MNLSIIVAFSENRVIGKNNQLPWSLPEDLKRFKKITWGHPILMGRKTYESIGRPLPGRENWVLTSNKNYEVAGVKTVQSWNEAMEKLRESPFFVIGGASLFEKALPLAETLYLTEIHQQIEGDTFFPPINWNLFLQKEREEHKAPPFNYSFSTWSRR